MGTLFISKCSLERTFDIWCWLLQTVKSSSSEMYSVNNIHVYMTHRIVPSKMQQNYLFCHYDIQYVATSTCFMKWIKDVWFIIQYWMLKSIKPSPYSYFPHQLSNAEINSNGPLTITIISSRYAPLSMPDICRSVVYWPIDEYMPFCIFLPMRKHCSFEIFSSIILFSSTCL